MRTGQSARRESHAPAASVASRHGNNHAKSHAADVAAALKRRCPSAAEIYRTGSEPRAAERRRRTERERVDGGHSRERETRTDT